MMPKQFIDPWKNAAYRLLPSKNENEFVVEKAKDRLVLPVRTRNEAMVVLHHLNDPHGRYYTVREAYGVYHIVWRVNETDDTFYSVLKIAAKIRAVENIIGKLNKEYNSVVRKLLKE